MSQRIFHQNLNTSGNPLLYRILSGVSNDQYFKRASHAHSAAWRSLQLSTLELLILSRRDTA